MALLKKLALIGIYFLVLAVFLIDVDLHTTLKIDWDVVGLCALGIVLFVSIL